MAKYSTGGGGGGDDGDACEPLRARPQTSSGPRSPGRSSSSARTAAPDDAGNARRARRIRWESGRKFRRKPGGASSESTGTGTEPEEGNRPQAGEDGLRDRRLKHWEEGGTNYESDRLPYLVSGYGDDVAAARQRRRTHGRGAGRGIRRRRDDLFAVEDGRAATAGVGGSVVRALEERLGVDIVDE